MTISNYVGAVGIVGIVGKTSSTLPYDNCIGHTDTWFNCTIGTAKYVELLIFFSGYFSLRC